MKVKGMISEAPPRSSLTEGAPQRSGEGSWAEERGGEGGGCYSSRMEIGEKRCSKRPGFACERPKHEVYALTRTVTTRVAPSKGSRMALSRSVTKIPGATSNR